MILKNESSVSNELVLGNAIDVPIMNDVMNKCNEKDCKTISLLLHTGIIVKSYLAKNKTIMDVVIYSM